MALTATIELLLRKLIDVAEQLDELLLVCFARLSHAITVGLQLGILFKADDPALGL